MPKLEDFACGSNVATSPLAEGPKRDHVHYTSNNNDYAYDTIVANYLILGFENEQFRSAYVAFPGRSNFDKATKIFLGRYGKPDESNSATGGHYWIGNDLSVRLQYEPNTEEGILAITCQGGQRTA